MRHMTLYGGAFVSAILFYLLQQYLRSAYYPRLMPPLTGATIDALFTIIYGLCAFVMIGATTDFLWRRYAKRQLMKQRLVPGLKAAPKPDRPTTTPAKSKVFH